uniref:Uncharacterized protein n=1 Tax=Glossina brevipalpis TaxID=37001 RepID=A0A1A9W7R0_9MUSC
MFEQWAQYRNGFLQSRIDGLSAVRINNLLENEMSKRQEKRDRCDLAHKDNRPCPPKANYFESRSQLAYGFWALPKLMKELGSDNIDEQWRAINSLAEHISNPLHGQRAINAFEIVRRCQNVFIRLYKRYHMTRTREMQDLVAQHMNGGKHILRSESLIGHLYDIVYNRDNMMYTASSILELITRDNDDIYYLQEHYRALNKLTDIYSRDVCAFSYPPSLWRHLARFLELMPQKAMDRGFYMILRKRIQGRLYNYHMYDMKCFGLLLRCPEGLRQFLHCDGVKEIYSILSDKNKILSSYENVVFVLMNGLCGKIILWRCSELIDLPNFIVDLAKDHKNIIMQLWCFQCLRELGEVPCTKRYIRENFYDVIKNIECGSDVNEKERAELLYWLSREVYHTSNLRVHDREKNPCADQSAQLTKLALDDRHEKEIRMETL